MGAGHDSDEAVLLIEECSYPKLDVAYPLGRPYLGRNPSDAVAR